MEDSYKQDSIKRKGLNSILLYANDEIIISKFEPKLQIKAETLRKCII